MRLPLPRGSDGIPCRLQLGHGQAHRILEGRWPLTTSWANRPLSKGLATTGELARNSRAKSPRTCSGPVMHQVFALSRCRRCLAEFSFRSPHWVPWPLQADPRQASGKGFKAGFDGHGGRKRGRSPVVGACSEQVAYPTGQGNPSSDCKAGAPRGANQLAWRSTPLRASGPAGRPSCCGQRRIFSPAGRPFRAGSTRPAGHPHQPGRSGGERIRPWRYEGPDGARWGGLSPTARNSSSDRITAWKPGSGSLNSHQLPQSAGPAEVGDSAPIVASSAWSPTVAGPQQEFVRGQRPTTAKPPLSAINALRTKVQA